MKVCDGVVARIRANKCTLQDYEDAKQRLRRSEGYKLYAAKSVLRDVLLSLGERAPVPVYACLPRAMCALWTEQQWDAMPDQDKKMHFHAHPCIAEQAAILTRRQAKDEERWRDASVPIIKSAEPLSVAQNNVFCMYINVLLNLQDDGMVHVYDCDQGAVAWHLGSIETPVLHGNEEFDPIYIDPNAPTDHGWTTDWDNECIIDDGFGIFCVNREHFYLIACVRACTCSGPCNPIGVGRVFVSRSLQRLMNVGATSRQRALASEYVRTLN